MTLLDSLREVRQLRRHLLEQESGPDPFGVPLSSVQSPTEATIDGRPVIMAGSNNYLGLTFDAECISAAVDALHLAGTGTTGSRLANGSYAAHVGLESDLADFFDRGVCVVFSAGYLANVGMISALVGRGDVVLVDADCHASIHDGCRLSGGDVLRFRHNDPLSLEKRLERLGERASRTLVIVEGIYSILGDRAPLEEIVELKRRFGCWLMVDEAHSLGVLGKSGRGLVEEVGVETDVDFIVGTFSKSLGGVGGFCVGDHPELDYVRLTSRPYIFTSSSPPSVAASTQAALKAMRSRPELRTRLWDNSRRLHTALEDVGFRLGAEVSPIVAVHCDNAGEALSMWRELVERGVYVNMMVPPATPNGESLLRCSVSAAHTPDQIDRICEAFAALPRKVAAT